MRPIRMLPMKLNNANYFSPEANRAYMSTSQIKSLMACEAAAVAELNGTWTRPPSKAMIMSSYIDAYFSGEMDEFKSLHPDIFMKNGSLKADFVKAEKIIARAEADEMFMKYLSGNAQTIMTGEIEGVPVKIKIDSYHPGEMIVDLKVMKDFLPIYIEGLGKVTWPEAYRYTLQAAIYQEIVYQNTGKRLPFYLAAMTKEEEPDMQLIQIPQSYMDAEMEELRSRITYLQLVKSGIVEPIRCEKCAYCRSTRKLTEPVSLEELKNQLA